MEHIGKLLQTATVSPSPSSTPQSPTAPRAWALGFSERMRSLFRQAWTSQWTTADEHERLLADYSAMLAKLTPEQIRTGLDACIGRTYPQNPSEFYGLASAREAPKTAAHQPYKSLPKPRRGREDIAGVFADLRAALRQDQYLPKDAA
jgi:hypothetical protein